MKIKMGIKKVNFKLNFKIESVAFISIFFIIVTAICVGMLWSPHMIYNTHMHVSDYKRIGVGILAGVALTILCGIVEKKYNISNFLKTFLINNAISLIIFLITFVVEAVAINEGFHYKFAFVFGVVMTIVLIVLSFRRLDKKIESTVLGVLLTVGITMLLVRPFGSISWDVGSHYNWAVGASYIGNTKFFTEADEEAMWNYEEFLTIPDSLSSNSKKIATLNSKYNEIVDKGQVKFSLAHLPAGIGIAVLRLIGCSFYWVFTLGVLPNLLLYSLVIYIALSRVHSGKTIIGIIAMFPMNIFLATNYSYDTWVTSFVILGMAYFIGMCQEKDGHVSTKDTVIMCGSLAIACVPKCIYAPVMLIPFFMPKKRIENKKKYYTICTAAFLVLALMFVLAYISTATGAGDARGGNVNPSGQIKYILSGPLSYAKMLIEFLKGYLAPEAMMHYINNFAYRGVGGGTLYIQLLLIVSVLVDKSDIDNRTFSWSVRVYNILLFFGTAALIATCLYVGFSEYKAEGISGCQPRYIVPLLYPLLSIISGGGIAKLENKKMFYLLVIVVCGYICLENIYTQLCVIFV